MVSLPFSGGREQSGERPAVVIQDGVYGQGSPLVLVVLLTSQLAALRFPASVQIQPSRENGLSFPSVAMVFQTRALDRTRFLRRIGVLEDDSLAGIIADGAPEEVATVDASTTGHYLLRVHNGAKAPFKA